jgi:hypothetical protein
LVEHLEPADGALLFTHGVHEVVSSGIGGWTEALRAVLPADPSGARFGTLLRRLTVARVSVPAA